VTLKALVSVVDDDPAVRDSVQTLLASIDIDTRCYASAREFLDAPNTMQPGCILLDLRIPDMSGLELQTLCTDRAQRKPVIFMTGYADVDVSVRAMRQGATEFLTKPVNDERLLQTVRQAIELNRTEQAEFNRRATLRARYDLLSEREQQVFEGIANGGSNKLIARDLRISHKTVELHRSNLMLKMRAGSLAELVRLYMELELNLQEAAS
jgi:two-component system response regulator FixJ